MTASTFPRCRVVVAVVVCAAVATTAACSGGSEGAATTTTSASTTASTTTSEVPMDPRSRLTARLSEELDDHGTAAAVVAAMDDAAIDGARALADDDIAGSPWLSYRPETVTADDVDSLWVFSYGYRFRDPSTPPSAPGGPAPSEDQVDPGPVNEALARAVAGFVRDRPVPIVAQWEVARVLDQMGVTDVISVGPDVAPDGTVTYLSTAGVAEKGRRLLTEAGQEPGTAGVLCFEWHAVRCLLTARSVGLDAGVPDGVELPDEFDPESGQAWTRSMEQWVPLDLAGRAALKG